MTLRNVIMLVSIVLLTGFSLMPPTNGVVLHRTNFVVGHPRTLIQTNTLKAPPNVPVSYKQILLVSTNLRQWKPIMTNMYPATNFWMTNTPTSFYRMLYQP